MPMHNPPNPSKLIRRLMDDWDSRDFFITEMGDLILEKLMSGEIKITSEIADVLSTVFEETTPESWLNQQKQYDEWVEKNKNHE